MRRAASGGVVLGAASALYLAAIEVTYVVTHSRGALGQPKAIAHYALYTLLVLLLAGALAGAVAGVILGALGMLANRLGRRHSSAQAWLARMVAVLVTPAIALVCAAAFTGRKARTIAHKDLIAVGLGLCGVLSVYVAVRVIARQKERIGRGVMPLAPAVALAVAWLALSAGLYFADQRVLLRLYPFFHVALAVGAFVAAELGIGCAYLCARRLDVRVGRLCDPSFALSLLLAVVAGGLFGLSALERAEGLRFAVFERSALMGKVVRLVGTVRPPPHAREHTIDPNIALDQPATPLPPGPRLPGADIFLISIDALRADHLSSYGYARATSPHVDALAREGVVFERAYAQVPHTSFSIATLLTGKYVYSLAALGDFERQDTLADILRRYRYKTAAFYPPSVFYIDERKFTTYQASSFGFEYVKFEFLDAERRVDQIINFLRSEQPERVFVWAHFFEPHEPYDAHPGVHVAGTAPSAAEDRYDGEIAYVDRALERLITHIRRTRPHAVIVVTADHGEEFGEHGGHYHGSSVYDEQVHVPLIVAAPGLVPHRVAGPVELVDVPVTLLNLVDVTPSARMRGTDLTPWLRDPQPPPLAAPPAFAEIESKKMVALAQTKLICDTARDSCELYDLARDPGERKNLMADEPQRGAGLRHVLDTWITSHSQLEHTEFRGVGEVARSALERGRMGDAQATGKLIELIGNADPDVRREAARLVARLPPDPSGRAALTRAIDDDAAGPWVRVALAQQCDDAAGARLREHPPTEPEQAARAAVAITQCGGALPISLFKLGLSSEDVTLRRQVALALGKSGRPEAVSVLLAQLDGVLERREVVEALGQTGSPRAIAALEHRLLADPYLPVRDEAARSLARVAGARAAPALRHALAVEQEPLVSATLIGLLYDLGQLPGAVAGASGQVVAPRGELWVGVPAGATGTLAVESPHEARAQAELAGKARAYRFAIPKGGANVHVKGPVAFLYGR
jgi:arylsulfatase A-like enzyme